MDVRRYLIAYDIADDKRRDRLARVLKSFGDRVQYSVFIVDITPARLVRLVARLETSIVQTEDSVLVCEVGPLDASMGRRFRFLGVGAPITLQESFIL